LIEKFQLGLLNYRSYKDVLLPHIIGDYASGVALIPERARNSNGSYTSYMYDSERNEPNTNHMRR